MRIFWSFMALLILVALVALLMPADQLDKLTRTVEVALRGEPRGVGAAVQREVDDAPVAPVTKEPVVAQAPVPVDDEPASESTSGEIATDEPPVATTPTTTEQTEPPAPVKVEPPAVTAAPPAEKATPTPATAVDPAAETVVAAKPEKRPEAAPETAPKDADAAGESSESVLAADDRFTVKGTGTKADPYVITWELLTSAYETYRPREGEEEIPPRIQKLHDKHVRITGYLAFPMLVGEVTEALVMLNQWDGCCVGVPPTPYDSIEVSLVSPVEAQRDAFTPFGSVTGKLKVDPYIVNGWLVGLYIVDGARLDLLN